MDEQQRGDAREARREKWRRILLEQQASGMTAAAFCRGRAIPCWKFSYWRKALGLRGSEGARPDGFVEVGPTRRSAGVWVEAGRWRVRVEPGFDAGTLLRAVTALAAS